MKYIGNRTHPFEYQGNLIATSDELEGDPKDQQIIELLDKGWIVTATVPEPAPKKQKLSDILPGGE